jgi:hypothetical protein
MVLVRFDMALFRHLRTALTIGLFGCFIYATYTAIVQYLTEHVGIVISATTEPTILPSFTICPLEISDPITADKMQSGQNTTFTEFLNLSINMKKRIDTSIMVMKEYSFDGYYIKYFYFFS